jgi:hypothetical protein
MRREALFATLFLGVAAAQVTTYTYTGNNFSQVSGAFATSDHLSISLTKAPRFNSRAPLELGVSFLPRMAPLGVG